jgi:hypothetical protein
MKQVMSCSHLNEKWKWIISTGIGPIKEIGFLPVKLSHKVLEIDSR